MLKKEAALEGVGNAVTGRLWLHFMSTLEANGVKSGCLKDKKERVNSRIKGSCQGCPPSPLSSSFTLVKWLARQKDGSSKWPSETAFETAAKSRRHTFVHTAPSSWPHPSSSATATTEAFFANGKGQCLFTVDTECLVSPWALRLGLADMYGGAF